MLHTLIGLLCGLFWLSNAFAHEPLRTIRGLKSPRAETMRRVSTARVAILDYDLIQRDFAVTRGMTEAQIDEWVLDKTAYVSEAQAGQTKTNTPIQITAQTASAHRPKDYGRAIVFETGDGGLIDAKGVGVAKGVQPHAFGHGDGLATLGETTREFLYEKLVRTVLTHAGSEFDTVEHYGVIDLGFDVVHSDGTKSPAGVILRQAHTRAPGRSSLLSNAESLAMETTLRAYGLTSAGAYRNQNAIEQINVQGTPTRSVLDFGGYLSVEKFEKPAGHFWTPKDILLQPGSIQFVQPKAQLRVSFANWGYSVSGIADPKLDNPWVWSHELARDFRSGRAGRAAFKTHFDNLVGGYRRSIALLEGAAKPGAMDALIRAMVRIK